ncbi:hypothetical protein GCM10009765_20110 [Fodinicola feengrottensis]|uniref:Exo-alpha-sialidase n=1 Tax=Fodinicola feengrottensis TaxID=435914 RepID=A0ABP4SEC3_9ACTN
MPDIDFAEVRDEIDSQLSPPLPIADITHRAHRRNRARAAVTVLTVGVAVAAVTVGAIQLTADRERSPVVPPAGVTDPTPPSGKAGPITPPVRSSTFPAGSQATFTAAVNQKISYAITRLPGIAVTFAWSRTVDGGLTWVSHDLPTLAQPVGTPFTSGPQVLDLTTVIAGQLISHDGGTSWTRRPASGVAVSVLPAGWVLSAPGVDGPIVAIDPADGASHTFTGAPKNCSRPYSGEPTDGSIWLGCPGGLVVSHNRGASWKAFHVLPADANKGTTFTGLTGDQPIVWVDSADGQRGYAIADGGAPGARQQTIFRTDNGGTSWQKIRVVQGNVPTMDGGLTGLSVLPDGSFLNGGVTANIKPLVRSSDDGATYQPLAPVFPTEDPVRTPLGTFVSFHWEDVGSPKNIYVVSDDGIHWSPIPVPTGVKPPQF